MKSMNQTRLTVVLSALLLAGTGVFAAVNPLADSSPAQKLSAAVDTTATLESIQSASFDGREIVLVGIETHVRAVDGVLSSVKLTDADKDDVKKAADKVADSIRKARGAAADDWSSVRSEVADSYSAYAAVAVRVTHDAPAGDK